jgi:hypothetical protein
MDEALLAENVDEPDSESDDFLASSCPLGPTLPPFLPPFLPLPADSESPSRTSVFVQPDPPPDPHNLESGASAASADTTVPLIVTGWDRSSLCEPELLCCALVQVLEGFHRARDTRKQYQ